MTNGFSYIMKFLIFLVQSMNICKHRIFKMYKAKEFLRLIHIFFFGNSNIP